MCDGISKSACKNSLFPVVGAQRNLTSIGTLERLNLQAQTENMSLSHRFPVLLRSLARKFLEQADEI